MAGESGNFNCIVVGFDDAENTVKLKTFGIKGYTTESLLTKLHVEEHNKERTAEDLYCLKFYQETKQQQFSDQINTSSVPGLDLTTHIKLNRVNYAVFFAKNDYEITE
jgi:hypothetical protein